MFEGQWFTDLEEGENLICEGQFVLCEGFRDYVSKIEDAFVFSLDVFGILVRLNFKFSLVN